MEALALEFKIITPNYSYINYLKVIVVDVIKK
jgi:hypothetical protein